MTSRFFLLLVAWVLLPFEVRSYGQPDRLKLVIETDAGGDPDDEQSLVRFLLYANEWDVQGIIANRTLAREGENRNRERTGLGIVQQLVKAYASVWTNLLQHDSRYPSGETLLSRVIPGYHDRHDAVDFLIKTIDAASPERPFWYSDWGTDHGAGPNNLKRTLDKILAERGPTGYANFKSRIALASSDAFGPHTWEIAPPFPLWIDTWQPEINRKRWYHQFSVITANAGGFDIIKDVITGHGPLGALYPTNTTHWLKEGDSMSFIYLIPTGMNHPLNPLWGSWAGRYGLRTNAGSFNYYWANQEDVWAGTTNRNNMVARWAEALQNDFKARLDWCVQPRGQANHPPIVKVAGTSRLDAKAGSTLELDSTASMDPDGNSLTFHWEQYREAGSYSGIVRFSDVQPGLIRVTLPPVEAGELHLILSVADHGSPKLTRFHRAVVNVTQ